MLENITPQQTTDLQNFILVNFKNNLPNPNGSFDVDILHRMLNADSTFKIWRSITPVNDIQDAIIWANFTPANPGTAVDLLTAQNIANWLLACQGKQFNLQLLLGASGVFGQGISTGKANIRAGLQDCLTAIPSGTLGANKTGGWTNVQLIIQRPASEVERILASGTGTTASPGNMSSEGPISREETVRFILNPDGTWRF